VDDFRDAAVVAGYDWQAGGHGFEENSREGLTPTNQCKNISFLHLLENFRMANLARHFDLIFEGTGISSLFHFYPIRAISQDSQNNIRIF
jgi:hypothetical protein